MNSKESNVMRALQVVMEHIGTRNSKKLKTIIDVTQRLEAEEAQKAYQKNMKAWTLADADTLLVVARTLVELKRLRVDPYDPDSTLSGTDISYFQSKFRTVTQFQYAIQCIATRGYDAEVWFDESTVLFCFGRKTTEHSEWYKTVFATPDPDRKYPAYTSLFELK